jgi:hypothetical protein
MGTVAVHRKNANHVAKRSPDDRIVAPKLSSQSEYATSHTVAPHLHLIAPAQVSEPIGVYRAADSTWPLIQPSLQVSSPEDASEREACATASKVTRMNVPDGSVAYVNTGTGRVFRLLKSPAAPEPFQIRERPHTIASAALTIPLVRRKPVDYQIQLQPERRPAATAGAAARIQSSMAGGAPLPLGVRHFMEPRFGADFSNVRIHTDTQAAALNRQLSARAFTVQNHVFFSQGSFQPASDAGRELIAHELTHTIQQGAAPQRDAIDRSEAVEVSQQSSPMVQRLGLSDILDGLASLAANLPGFTLLTVIIGRNPINMRPVERNFTNLLRGFTGLIPGGEILFQVLERYRIVERLGSWASEQTRALGLNFDYLRNRFNAFTDSLSWTDIFSPGDVWRRAENIFSEPINRIRSFISRLTDQAIAWLKETFMQPLSNFCREIPGYTLVTVLLGRDPFTNAPVERSALNVVRGFAEFIPGGTEKVNQLVESRALQRAYEWFIQETQARNLTWARVTGTFAQAWDSLQLEDVLHPIDTLQRMITLFRPLMSDLVSFAGAALMKLLEFIFEAAMGAGGARILAILKRARNTFEMIINDPVGFLGNLLRAVGQGVRQFMTNILTHLRQGVIAWLTGPVAQAGIQMPEQWDLRGIIWFVLQILGLTWDRIRQKLVRLMGDRAVAMLESGFQLILDIRRLGLVQALRERVTEFFGQLRDAALGSIRSFIQERLVMAGIQQLISLLSPVGAVIQAIIKTYTTIKFFIDRINQILDLVESIVNSISAIASGSIGAAANFIERTMARTIPIILDFLARFIGIGDVGGHVQRTIRGLQARVDQMLDRAVDWIRNMARNLVSRALGGDPNAPAEQREESALREAVPLVNRYAGRPVGELVLRPLLLPIRLRYRLRRLDVVDVGGNWTIEAEASPKKTAATSAVAASTYGTVADPIPINWAGPPTSAYPKLYFGGRLPPARRPMAQSILRGLFTRGLNVEGEPVQEYSPHGRKQLPGGARLGLGFALTTHEVGRISVGKIVGPLSTDTTPGGDTLRQAIAPYGFNSTTDGLELDHVHETQFGGISQNDRIENLWPLQSSLNSSKGSTLASAGVEYPKGTNTTIAALKPLITATKKFWFKVRSVR